MASNVYKIYPYPVLGNNDDIEGVFHYTIEPEISGDRVEISVEFKLNHPDLQNMINHGYATFSVDVSCKKTLYKKTSQSQNANISVSIPASSLKDRVDVEGYIIVTERIPKFRPQGIRLDMDLGAVSVEPGDIVADGGVKWFIADKYFDPLKSPVSSFIKIMKSNTEDGAYSVDFDNPVITIKVPEIQFNDFDYVNKHKDGVFIHASVVLPVLVEAILKLDDEDYVTYSWADKLGSMITLKNFDRYVPFVAAQELLGLPVKRHADAVINIIKMNEDDNE